jgi:hypothetical protein
VCSEQGARDRSICVSPGALKAVPGAAVQIVSTAEGKMVVSSAGCWEPAA